MSASSSITAEFKTASHRYGTSVSISISSGVFPSDLAEFVGFFTGSMVKRVSASTGRGRFSSVAGWDQAIERVQNRGLDLKGQGGRLAGHQRPSASQACRGRYMASITRYILFPEQRTGARGTGK
ncbi:hypothetical protein H112_08451 [Trichophyton rubrum D6]|uniref:Uncharacterized protein n=2 Tax=Trichophyton TaxID=5550 RepID=A0A022VNY2_TRIRU|nr:hypothetical protein H100_08474 [Trichophyton rubrum MR850]EZF37133.1 hypothetical protein H102_08433 [Trichophyton rubrum CBS 100081]EZF47696.1 hypothetical protein H103_08456 [Trichophyton rubrum CBS 288.86]EZF58486.1 hypothetical protein H104_08409 [Trichophyton rubrum CBS 289.86]EZF69055.1 hypothetical protein H105_08462 [Trichophyton soudanense CBS 452.61]EZF79705.1 hypothetical protein H110_08459 [Trichophyton rubrum MR1448]EZF90301.1 hypothetical protein H113_08527 [Trichophyton rub